MAIKPSAQNIVVVIVPLPAQGHLNQLLHLSRLISAYDIPVHYIGTTTHNRQAKTRVHGWNPLANSNIFFHEFPIPSFHTPPPNPNPNPNAPTKFPSQLIPSFHASLQLREHIFKLVSHLSTSAKRIIVIHDNLMAYPVQDVTDIPTAESYCFHSCSVFTLYSFIWESAGKPRLPEIESNLFENLPSIESCFNPEVFEFTKPNQECKKSNSGYLYNTCRAIEGCFLDLVAQSVVTETDKNWAIGPFNPIAISEKKHGSDKCIEWLDKQPVNSVIFVSFGTTTSFTDDEINEIAVGLEKSGQKFIWVVREADKGDVFTTEEEVRKVQLPEGYEERVKERGMIIREWAPQLEILGHPSTGGFMSHCGWNSCIESISLGVPIAAWPMHSDQPRNAILITMILRIGIVVKEWDQRDGIVKAETIENAVRKLLDTSEGDEIRKRAVKLSEDVKKSVMEGGQSHLDMESFIAHICR